MLIERLKHIASKAEAIKLENTNLKTKLNILEQELSAAIVELEKEKNKNKITENNLKITKFASVLSSDGDNGNEEVLAKLDYFINHIDRCIDLLND